MTIEDKVRNEHDEIKALVVTLAGSTPEDVEGRRAALDDLIHLITGHEEAEERTFYRAMREDERLREMALEGIEQHSIIETLLVNLSGIDPEDELWLPKLMAMKGVLDSHILVEERLLLPTAHDILGSEAMVRLDREYGPVRARRRVGMLGPTTA